MCKKGKIKNRSTDIVRSGVGKERTKRRKVRTEKQEEKWSRKDEGEASGHWCEEQREWSERVVDVVWGFCVV